MVIDVGVATDKAMEQAKRAGVSMLGAVATDVTVDKDGDYVVTLRTPDAAYQACVAQNTGRILYWRRTWTRAT